MYVQEEEKMMMRKKEDKWEIKENIQIGKGLDKQVFSVREWEGFGQTRTTS